MQFLFYYGPFKVLKFQVTAIKLIKLFILLPNKCFLRLLRLMYKTIFFKKRIYFKPVEDQCPTDLTGFFKIEWIERKGYVTLVANNTLFQKSECGLSAAWLLTIDTGSCPSVVDNSYWFIVLGQFKFKVNFSIFSHFTSDLGKEMFNINCFEHMMHSLSLFPFSEMIVNLRYSASEWSAETIASLSLVESQHSDT